MVLECIPGILLVALPSTVSNRASEGRIKREIPILKRGRSQMRYKMLLWQNYVLIGFFTVHGVRASGRFTKLVGNIRMITMCDPSVCVSFR